MRPATERVIAGCTRTVSFNLSTYRNHIKNKEKQEKAAKKGKTFVPDTVKQQRTSTTIYQVYRTDSVGNSRTDDFVMSQLTVIGRHRHSGTEYLIQVQSYATDYAYIDKKEYKQQRKDNQVDMNIDELRRFEKNNTKNDIIHHINSVIAEVTNSSKYGTSIRIRALNNIELLFNAYVSVMSIHEEATRRFKESCD